MVESGSRSNHTHAVAGDWKKIKVNQAKEKEKKIEIFLKFGRIGVYKSIVL